MSIEQTKQFLQSHSSLQLAIDAFFTDPGAVPDVIEVPDSINPPVATSSAVQVSSLDPPWLTLPSKPKSLYRPVTQKLTCSSPQLDEEDPDYVRPPIAPKRDVLILPEYDNFRSVKRRNTTQALCPLRNFAREAGEKASQFFDFSSDSVNFPNLF